MRDKKSLTRSQIPIFRILKKLIEIYKEIKFYFIDKINRHFKAKKYLDLNKIKLNLGCAKATKKRFINIDFMKFGDLRLDLRKTLPFKDNSVDYIFTEHFFQYIDFIDSVVIRCMSDYYRILKKGGKIRMIIPNHEKIFKAYAKKDISFFQSFMRIDNKLPHPFRYASIIDYINYSFQYGKVRYCYDFEKIHILLKSIGFNNVIKDNFNPKEDTDSRKTYSLYIVAEK